jgi:hypothetical protein
MIERKIKRNRRHGMWVAHRVVKQHGRIKNKKNSRQHGVWVARRIVIILPVSFSPSTHSPHSFNPPNSLSLSSIWLLGQATWVLLQRGGGGVVHGIIEVDKLTLGWPTYGHWPGRSTAAVGGRAVVVVV